MTTTIDPRIRARRVEVKRGEGRRRLRRLAVVGAVAGVVVAGGGLVMSPLLDVDRVVVVGPGPVEQAAVLRASGLHRHAPMIGVSEDGAAHAVEALPWVAGATVVRHWPGTVTITVSARRPVAVVPAVDGRWAQVDEHGRVLSIVDQPGPLFRLEGTAPVVRAGMRLAAPAVGALRLAAALPPDLRGRVDRLRVSDGGIELLLRLGGRTPAVATFGPPDALPTKLLALATVLDSVPDAARLATVDVRVPGSPVLTRR